MLEPKIITLPANTYDIEITKIIAKEVNAIIDDYGRCSLMLTGGQTAKELYHIWSKDNPWDHSKIDYYFGDERAVEYGNNESNYCMVMDTLFSTRKPDECIIHRIKGEVENLNGEARRYALLIPKPIDVLILTVGQDGHIASLFPKSESLNETKNSVVVVSDSPKLPKKRITITPKVIESARNVILMAKDKDKGIILGKALQNLDNGSTI